MSFEEQPIPAELLREQEQVQKEKDNKRLLDEYVQYLFLGSIWRERHTTEVQELINSELGVKIDNINDLLLALYKRNRRTIHWADMGGGHALPQRQIANDKHLSSIVKSTNVDLFKLDDKDFEKKEIEYLNQKYEGILNPKNRPNFIKANIENVQLPTKADLITSVEVIQYLNNPLQALTNWYNQLADDAFMFVSTEHKWSDWVRYDNNSDPLPSFFSALEEMGIPFSFSLDSYKPEHSIRTNLKRGFCNLVIKKAPNTNIHLLAEVDKIWINPHKYKAVYYKPHPKVIEIVRS